MSRWLVCGANASIASPETTLAVFVAFAGSSFADAASMGVVTFVLSRSGGRRDSCDYHTMTVIQSSIPVQVLPFVSVNSGV
jgi:hypothetical protein